MKKTIWIDLDNSPHVPFFVPIIDELKRKGYGVRITTRDCSQTCGLADLHRVEYSKIGRHYGKIKAVKVAATIVRAMQLVMAFAHEKKPVLALSHGSRAQTLSALLLGVPSMVIMDYEHVTGFVKPSWVVMPDLISSDSLPMNPERIFKYHGIKEDVYVPSFRPDLTIRERLGFAEDDIVVTVRPPATEAHYHNTESEVLFTAAVNRIEQMDHVKIAILPRYKRQKELICSIWSSSIAAGKIAVPDQVVDGLSLLWTSDLVISGGGTMNREAAALGVPVYSIFRGRIGAVDRWLEERGRLVMIRSVADVYKEIRVQRRNRGTLPSSNVSRTLLEIVGHIENAASLHD